MRRRVDSLYCGGWAGGFSFNLGKIVTGWFSRYRCCVVLGQELSKVVPVWDATYRSECKALGPGFTNSGQIGVRPCRQR